MRILVINGPNLNMLGKREPEVYGKETYQDLVTKIEVYCKKQGIECEIMQSNYEGEIIDKISNIDGVINIEHAILLQIIRNTYDWGTSLNPKRLA